MSGVAYGGEQPPPDLRELAESLYVVLALERAFGTLPEHSELRVFVINHCRLFVAIGGLGDRFLLGHHAHLGASQPHATDQPKVADHYYTGPALRLRRDIEELLDRTLPREADGSHWFLTVVWLQPQAWTEISADRPEGVTVITDGEVQ